MSNDPVTPSVLQGAPPSAVIHLLLPHTELGPAGYSSHHLLHHHQHQLHQDLAHVECACLPTFELRPLAALKYPETNQKSQNDEERL